ncbi:helix-turn-helix domain-containing protein [Arthrobacter sp. BPSS-3]|uniref:helix-turn-helix domain-containing protein n=1 Tax=Arthrobacter sp. BPSS-3 TaxID=3366580 RepID=UPI0037DC9B7B
MHQQQEESPTLTVAEAKEIAGIGMSQMYAAIKEGTIPSLRIGRRILIPRKKFMALLNGEAA